MFNDYVLFKGIREMFQYAMRGKLLLGRMEHLPVRLELTHLKVIKLLF